MDDLAVAAHARDYFLDRLRGTGQLQVRQQQLFFLLILLVVGWLGVWVACCQPAAPAKATTNS